MTAKIARFSWLPLALALAAGVSAQPPAAPTPEPQADWKAAEGPFLSDYAQLTLPDRFIKAGEAYFDHQTPPRWIVFQATERPAKRGEEPSPHYAMYVAKLKYEGENIVGIDAPARLSQPGTANTCGWFHPTKPYTVLFGSTLTEPKKSDRPGFRVGTRNYVWQFPDEMEVCEINVGAIAKELPAGDPLGEDVRGMEALLREKMPAISELRKAGRLEAYGEAFDSLMAECDKKFPTARAIKNWVGGRAKPVFRRDRYDAECSYSPDGRFILYTHVREAPAADAPAKDDGDIWIFDTQTLKQYPIVTADGYDGGPFFSPDGQRICYRSDRKGDDKLQLFVADLKFEAGVPVGVKREHQLTMDENVNWAPFWHPSGKFLIYGSSAAGHSNYEVFAIPVPPLDSKDESDRARPARRITLAPGADILPVFSADGTWMMWTSQRGGVQPGEQRPTSQVWVARVRVDSLPWASLPDQRITPLDRNAATERIVQLLRQAETEGKRKMGDKGHFPDFDLAGLKVVRIHGGWRGRVNPWNVPDGGQVVLVLDDGRESLSSEYGAPPENPEMRELLFSPAIPDPPSP